MENSSILLALLYAAAVALIFKIVESRRRQPARKLPPGPKPWPIIGNLNLLGSLPHRSLHLVSQKYGEIMLLKFGKFPVVIASSPEMAEQFLRVHDANFASRPALAAGKYLSYNYSDVSFAPYGRHWREARKILMMEVLSSKKLDSFEQIRVEESRGFYSRLRSLSGKPVVLRDELLRYNLSTISRVALGEKYFCESGERKSVVELEELLEMVNEWLLLTAVFNAGDWIPWLGFLDLQGYVKRMKALRKKMDRFYDYVIDDHLAKRGEGKDTLKKDFVDVLLQMIEDQSNAEIELTRDCVKALITGLLVGGTDTSASAVEWGMSEILKQPRIIEKAKAELDSVIGRNRWVHESDFTQLPYIDSIIMETFRLHPLGTLLAPHYAIQDSNVGGYDIPKGTTVLVNSWSIQRNPKWWDAPDEFMPERFMGREIDMIGSSFSLLPFGSGRRRCVGYNLGLNTVRTTLANLLHGFEVKLGEGMRVEDISMEEEYGLATHLKYPLTIIVNPTLPHLLY